MKNILILLAFFSTYTFSQTPETEVTTYYLIRHAEKDLSNPSDKNPHLDSVGIQRAENWKNQFKDVTFNAVYSTNYHRTIETAQPTSTKNNLDITFYDPRGIAIEAFKNENEGKTILIVGHSNTIPKFANALIGEEVYEEIDESVYGHLYVVTIAKFGIDYSLEVID